MTAHPQAHRAAERIDLLRADGALVPDAAAADVLRRLVRQLTAEVRSTGAAIPAGTQQLLGALYSAAQRHDHGHAHGRASVSSLERTTPGDSSTVEMTVADVAERLECSPRWVQRLARRGAITARRIGRTWLLDAASVESYRRNGTAA